MQYKLAKEANAEMHKSSYMLILPNTLIKTNSFDDNWSDSLSEADRYFAKIDSSNFLKKIQEDTFINRIQWELVAQMQTQGLKAYLPNQIEAFALDTNIKYDIRIEQLELEEYPDVFIDEMDEDDNYYSQELEVNALSLNAWIRVNYILNDSIRTNLIYSSYAIQDRVDGYFYRKFMMFQMLYKYNYYPIDSAQLNQFPIEASQQYLQDVLDFILNTYVETEYLKVYGRYPELLYRYNIKNQRFYPTDRKSHYIILE